MLNVKKESLLDFFVKLRNVLAVCYQLSTYHSWTSLEKIFVLLWRQFMAKTSESKQVHRLSSSMKKPHP